MSVRSWPLSWDGFGDLVDGTLTLTGPGSASRGLKALSAAAILTGGEGLDDVPVLRAGGTEELLGAVRAPSTIGTRSRRSTAARSVNSTGSPV